MKKVLLLCSLALALTAVLPSCSNSSKKETEQTEAKKVAYACPMKCEGDKTYDKTGKCPECGMDLEKVEVANK
jgi:hypothetical protein